MTWITDASGTRWVDPLPSKPKRKRGRGRFADVKVGDQLMQHQVSRWSQYPKPAEGVANDPAPVDYERDHGYLYAIVTDMWFDPVAGQNDPLKGEMVAVQCLRQGRPFSIKRAHTIRGLASNKWQYADRDEIAHWDAIRTGIAEGSVTGIGKGRRNRPAERPLYRL